MGPRRRAARRVRGGVHDAPKRTARDGEQGREQLARLTARAWRRMDEREEAVGRLVALVRREEQHELRRVLLRGRSGAC
eukprot:7381860-Prymnesium_polylepis.2